MRLTRMISVWSGDSHGGMLHQCALDLERPDHVADGFDDVVRATDEPEIAVSVTPRQIPRENQPSTKYFA